MKKIPFRANDNFILGSALSYVKDPIDFFRDGIEKHGDIWSFRTLNKINIVISNTEYVSHFLQKNQKNYKRHFAYETLKILIGDGILSADGEKWKTQRKLMQPFFHKQKIKSYFDTMKDCAKVMVHQWETSTDEISLLKSMSKVTMDVISRCVFGKKINAADVVDHHLPIALELILKRIELPLLPPLWVPTPANTQLKKSVKAIYDIIEEVVKDSEKQETPGDDIISMYILAQRDGDSITRATILSEVITIFLAGHETSAIALFGLIKQLSLNPEIAEKGRLEFEKITKGEDITLEHLQELDYVNNIINEGLRLYSPAWSIAREAINHDEVDGYKIPKGSSILILTHHIQRHPDYWTDPNTFNPDRFKTEPSKKLAFIPFGSGPKMCVGNNLAMMEMQIILYYYLTSQFTADVPTNTIDEFHPTITLRPKRDFKLVKNISQPEQVIN